MKHILIGYGNVGKTLHTVLIERDIEVELIIRSKGIFNIKGEQIDTIDNFDKYIDKYTIAYISLPSSKEAHKNLPYYLTVLERGGSVITCEKSVLAHYWQILKPYMNRLWYSATVGGNSGILPELYRYHGKIEEIKAVINGTLNIIGERLAGGYSEDEIFSFVTREGFSEPGSKNFSELIAQEMQDVLYKAVILANHSGLYPSVVTLADIIHEPYQYSARCMLIVDKHHIRAGFIADDDISWFPRGVDNILLINGQKIVEGPGAGARPTAERMYTDGLNAL